MANEIEILPGFTRYSLERYYQYMATQGNRVEAAFTILHLAEMSVVDPDFAHDIGEAFDKAMKGKEFTVSPQFVEAQNALSERIQEERKILPCRVSSQVDALGAALSFVQESTYRNRREYISRYVEEFKAKR